MRFCPGCGAEIKKKERYCVNCKPKENLNVRKIHLKVCSSCHKYLHKNKWTKFENLEKAIIKIAKDAVKDNIRELYFKPILPKFDFKPGIKKYFEVEISRNEDIFIVPGKLEISYCNNCAKQQGDYFEGTLQLRNINTDILEFIKQYLKDNNIFISKEKKLSNGFDITVSDKKKIQNLGSILHKKYGGTLKISPRLHTRDKQTSKDVYRVNVYYESPNYKIGDVIRVDDKLVLVTKINKNIIGKNLETGKHSSVNLGNKEYEILQPRKTTVSKIHPNIEVLDPDTYQSVSINNSKTVKQGEKVKIVNDHGLFYII